MNRAAVRLGLLVLALHPIAPAQAGSLSDAEIQACVQASAKIGTLDASGEPLGSGSGSMIDARGYVLTNFHVVGNVLSGRLHDPEGRVLVALAQSTTESTSYDWQGKVVRAAPRLDLALVRITGNRAGAPVQGAPFRVVPIGDQPGKTGSSVWTFGFPSGSRTVNMSTGIVAGIEKNLAEEISWIRTDAEFNPGNSGGMLVNDRGQLVGVPTRVILPDGRAIFSPINVARAAGRIPKEWLSALANGEISDFRSEGTFVLAPGQPLRDEVRGDGIVLDTPEAHSYVIEQPRPGVVTVQPTRPLILTDDEFEPARLGTGRIAVAAGDPSPTVVSVLVGEKERSPLAIRIDYEAIDRTFAIPPWSSDKKIYLVPPDLKERLDEDLKATAAAVQKCRAPVYVALYDDLITGLKPEAGESIAGAAAKRILSAWGAQPGFPKDAALVVWGLDLRQGYIYSDASPNLRVFKTAADRFQDVFKKATSLDDLLARMVALADAMFSADDAAGEGEAIGGVKVRIVDGLTGNPLSATVLIGKPGAALRETVEQLQAEKVPPSALKPLIQSASVTSHGMLFLIDLPAGATYPYAILSEGYKAKFGTFTIESNGQVVDLGTLELMSRAL